MKEFDVLIIGAGPAGMSAATAAKKHGLNVMLVDDQASPGGQIYRNIEANTESGAAKNLGADYQCGLSIVRAFRASRATYMPYTTVWQVNPNGDAYISTKGVSTKITAKYIVLATGSMERPAPVKGWTLPGVMTVGSAQIMQKTANAYPGKNVWIAGCGPLAIYYAYSLISQGHQIAGFLETTVGKNRLAARRHWVGALRGIHYLIKGLGYLARLKLSGVRHVGGVESIEILGSGRAEKVRWMRAGKWHEADADGVLLHEGVVPHTQLAIATGCQHEWNTTQGCYQPSASEFGQSSLDQILVAGDCRGIGGAKVAAIQGSLVGTEVAGRLGALSSQACAEQLRVLRQHMSREIAVRPFLDVLYAPRAAISKPPDTSVICRCEVVTAGAVRQAVRNGCQTVDGVKSLLRCGMGPCQGRMCGLSVAKLVADERQVGPEVVGPYRIRPPIKPISLGELAGLAVATDRK